MTQEQFTTINVALETPVPKDEGNMSVKVLHSGKRTADFGGRKLSRETSFGRKVDASRYKEKGIREQPHRRQRTYGGDTAKAEESEKSSTVIVRNSKPLRSNSDLLNAHSGTNSVKSGNSSFFPDVQARSSNLIKSVYENAHPNPKDRSHHRSQETTFRAPPQPNHDSVFKPNRNLVPNEKSTQAAASDLKTRDSKKRNSLSVGHNHSINHSVGAFHASKTSFGVSVYQTQMSQKERMLSELREK